MAAKDKKNEYTPERNKWSQKYHATHLRQIKFDLNIEHDADILAFLDSKSNRTGYIKELIRADIASHAELVAGSATLVDPEA